jgi:sucrose-6-phosphate hydrolase SacC (GH32 family)
MDPAAIFEANGVWHLFHDWESPAEIPQWSHATSPDAVHWQKHSIAIPFGVKGACDEGFAETGGVGVREDGVAVALYAGGTRYSGSGPGRSGTICNICASISTDAAHMNWTKIKEPVVPNLNNGSDWRDSTRPFRMPGDTENWWMIVGTSGAYGGTPTAAKAALFVCKDGSMLHWAEAGIFFDDENYHMMECPDAWPLTNRSDSDAPFFFMSSATVGKGDAVGAHWWVGRVSRSDPERPRFLPDFDGIWDWGAQDSRDPVMAATPTYTSTKSGPAGSAGFPRYIFSWVRGDGRFGTDWWKQHMSFNGVSAFPRTIRVTGHRRDEAGEACTAAATSACGGAKKASAGNCLVCTLRWSAHQARLQAAGCTDADLDAFCTALAPTGGPPAPPLLNSSRRSSLAGGQGQALRQDFIAAVGTLRVPSTEVSLESRCITPLSELPVPVHGRAQELIATFGTSSVACSASQPVSGGVDGGGTASSFGLTVFADCKGAVCEGTHVGYTRPTASAGGYLFVDRTNSTTFPMGQPEPTGMIQRAPLGLSVDADAAMTMHVLLDYSVIEVIADNGTHSAAITSCVYPLFNSSDGVPKLWADGSSQHVSLRAWELAQL